MKEHIELFYCNYNNISNEILRRKFFTEKRSIGVYYNLRNTHYNFKCEIKTQNLIAKSSEK